MPRVISKQTNKFTSVDPKRLSSTETIKLPKPVNIPRPPAPRQTEAAK